MKFEARFNADQSLQFQTRGAVFAVDNRSESILFSSTNAHRFAACEDPGNLLGRSVRGILGRDVTHALRNAESLPSLGRRRQHMGQFDLNGTVCDVTVFLSGNALILEAIPLVRERDPTAYDVMKDVDVLTDALLETDDQERMFNRLVALFRTMSGYHCVALDRYQGEATGTIAFAGREQMARVHFAAPAQLHVLFDIDAPRDDLSIPAGAVVPDMTLSALQLPSNEDIRALRKVDVRACMAMGLRCGDRVWGNLKFLHATPRMPNKRTQLALSHLAPLIGQRLLNTD